MTLNATTFEDAGEEMPAFKALLFGLDDTLYPKRQYTLSGFRAVSDYVDTLFGVPVYDTLVKCHEEGVREDIFRVALGRHFNDVEDCLLNRLAYVHALHRPSIALFQDASVALAFFAAHGVGTGVLATGQSAVQRRKVAALGLEPLVDGIIYTGDLNEAEPEDPHSEDAFRIMALQFGLECQDVAYVADNPKADFVVPKKLGMVTVRVRRAVGEHSRDEPPSVGHAPDVTLSSLDRLVNSFMQRVLA